MRTTTRRYGRLFVIFGLILFCSPLMATEPMQLKDVERITLEQLLELQKQETVLIIDTRAPSQWNQAKEKLPGAIRLATEQDISDLKSRVAADTAIVTYCT